MAHTYTPVTKSDNTYSSVTTPSKTYTGITKSDNSFNPVTTPDKTYSGLTKSDNSFTAVSDVTPSGTVEEKFTWANIAGWTWADLHNSGKTRWCDWYYGTAYTDNYTSLTTPDKTYNELTKSDNEFSSVTTPSKTYTGKTRSDRTYASVTTPSQTYNGVTK